MGSVIVSLIGHVDHGKSSFFKFLKNKLQTKEGFYIENEKLLNKNLKKEVFNNITQNFIVNEFKFEKNNISSIYLIDTPGHSFFNSIKKRAVIVSDLVYFIVDINKKIPEITVNILKLFLNKKIKLAIILTKIDLIKGWRLLSEIFHENYNLQSTITKKYFTIKITDIKNVLLSIGYNSDLYFEKRTIETISLFPVSNFTGEGISEVIKKTTSISVKIQKLPFKGYILEIILKPIQNILVVIFTGTLKPGQKIFIEGSEYKLLKILKNKKKVDIIKNKGIYNLYLKKYNFKPGCYFYRSENLKMSVKPSITKSIKKQGLILKSITYSGLEALEREIKKTNKPVLYSKLGNISKEDIMYLKLIKDFRFKYILFFGPKPRIYNANIVYSKKLPELIKKYEELTEKRTNDEIKYLKKELFKTKNFCLFENKVNFFFRKKNPVIFGVTITYGVLRKNNTIETIAGITIGTVISIGKNGINVPFAIKNETVAIKIDLNSNNHIPLFHKTGYFKTLFSSTELELIGKINNLNKNSFNFEEVGIINKYYLKNTTL